MDLDPRVIGSGFRAIPNDLRQVFMGTVLREVGCLHDRAARPPSAGQSNFTTLQFQEVRLRPVRGSSRARHAGEGRPRQTKRVPVHANRAVEVAVAEARSCRDFITLRGCQAGSGPLANNHLGTTRHLSGY